MCSVAPLIAAGEDIASAVEGGAEVGTAIEGAGKAAAGVEGADAVTVAAEEAKAKGTTDQGAGVLGAIARCIASGTSASAAVQAAAEKIIQQSDEMEKSKSQEEKGKCAKEIKVLLAAVRETLEQKK